jgi:glycosyltransferase involved in cell wall biosynthesis
MALSRIWPQTRQRYRLELLHSWIARRGLLRDIARYKPDVIHLHTQAIGLLCDRIAGNIPTVISLDATAHLLRRLPSFASHSLGLQMLASREQAIFNAARVCVPWSEWAAISLREDYRVSSSCVKRISPGIDLKRFSPGDKKAEGKPLKFLFVGNDFERKGGPLLLRVFAQHAKDDWDLDIVSSDNPPRLLPPRVRWLSRVQSGTDELCQLYRAADVFVLPTRNECFGLVFLEAMASGLPLIGTKVMAVPELVRDRINGIAVSPDDDSALFSAMSELAENQGQRQAYGATGRAIAEKEFDAEIQGASWESLLLDAHR